MNSDLYNTLIALVSANNHNSDSIEHLTKIADVLVKRVEALEQKPDIVFLRQMRDRLDEIERQLKPSPNTSKYGPGPYG
jgi:phosphoglycerate-specific signal transduction histidine kinase